MDRLELALAAEAKAGETTALSGVQYVLGDAMRRPVEPVNNHFRGESGKNRRI